MNLSKQGKWQKLFCLFLLSLFAFNLYAQTGIKHPDWSYDKSIYEVNIRQYTEKGTFKEFEKHLPRLKEMGVGILWLMPISPIGEKNRKGGLGSYYSVKDYLKINPEFGTLDDFKSLVESIHDNDMYVIIDWVANHTAWDNHLVKDHPDWYTKDSAGNFVPPVADWSDVIDLNYDSQGLREYMTEALKYWVEECDIDGYRCDVAGMVPTDFWINARKELDDIKPVFMLAEAEEPGLHVAFDMSYSWDIHHVMNRIAEGECKVDSLVKQLDRENTRFPADAFRMRFTSNHDENSWNGTEFERLGDAAETFAVLSNLIPGMPLIYNGQEVSMTKRLSFFEKDTIIWKEDKMTDLYQVLFNLKKVYQPLYNGEKGSALNLVSTKDDKNIFAFTREKEGQKIVAVFNLSPAQQKINLTSEALKGNFKNLFSKEEVNLKQSESFDLKPWEYKVYISR